MSQLLGSNGNSGSSIQEGSITYNLLLPSQNPTPEVGVSIRFRALNDFTPSEWKVSALNGTNIEFDIWVSSSGWPSFTSDSICNGSYPSLISGSDNASNSATTWDPILKDDFCVIYIRSGDSLENQIVLQILGTKD